MEAVDVDTDLNLVTECWVEPQNGFVTNCTDQRRYFQGLKYQEVPQAVRTAVWTFKKLFVIDNVDLCCFEDLSQRSCLYVHHDDL